ncbi:RNA 2'-phosphotransferase [Allonocardiopsis opalescens]|uniref:Probable RNA 2'-phosphotransferase n=1 Tax=Allonocardiopsis opalescens TaxID=1144618 RepID=A0A2T0PU14_9ACTN|nr:RNA 2'-phosphotransferase [Allonocardiopsis opalescens]PRX92392.1 putative RNA 2'-phosphotransferase [Allonocardiopsis opalescens]
MTDKRSVRVSKFLSRHLRHSPGRIGLRPDEAGWVAVEELLAACARAGLPITRAELDQVVAANDKRRFAFSDDGTRIRASQGHSIPVRLGLPPAVPPPVLYHGTARSALPAIEREGLRPMRRHDVHLSADPATALRVGARHGAPVVLRVDAAAMHADGREFRVSDNGVWLTAAVPPRYLRRLADAPPASRR